MKISDEKNKNIYILQLRYRCEGTLVACQYAGAGCTFRGPNKKVREHQADCSFKKEGEYRVGKNPPRCRKKINFVSLASLVVIALHCSITNAKCLG